MASYGRRKNFEVVWPGLERCLECGFVMATEDSEERSDEKGKEHKPKYQKENNLHSTYHGKFRKVRNQYGESHILSYTDLKYCMPAIKKQLGSLISLDFTVYLPTINYTLKLLYNNMVEIKNWIKQKKEYNKYFDIENADFNRIVTNYKSVKKEIQKYKEKNSDNISILFSILMPYSELISSIIKYDRVFGAVYSKYHIYNYYQNISFVNLDISDMLTDALNKRDSVNHILETFFNIEYTRSLKLWDLCKPHPCFEDYCILLWNTQKFRSLIKGYMTNNMYEYYVCHNYANRELVDFNFEEAPFYFGKIVEKKYDRHRKCVVRDFSYMDKILDSDDEDMNLASVENTPEYQESDRIVNLFASILAE